MLLDRAVLLNFFSRSNSQKQARKSGGHVVGKFNRTDYIRGEYFDLYRTSYHSLFQHGSEWGLSIVP